MYATFIYDPLYNGLMFLASSFPVLDAGMLIIIFTIIVKVILYPLSKKAVRTQALMKQVEPEMRAIKEKYKDDKQAQAAATMKLYKDKNVNPFSSILLLFIQIPILFAIYKIIYSTGFTEIHTEILYSFVKAPEFINTIFLGFVDVEAKKNIIFAILAAVSQYFQIKLSVPAMGPKTAGGGFQDDLMRNMQTQMKYVFPVMILVTSYSLPTALAIYWIVSNLFMIGQEIYIRRQMAREVR